MITLTTFELFYFEVLAPHGIAKFQIFDKWYVHIPLACPCILIWQWRGVPCKNLPESLSWSASCGSLSAPSSRTHRRKSGQPFWPVTTLPTLHFKAVQKLLSDLSTEIQRSAVRPVSRQFWPKQKQTSAGPARIEWGFHATFHQSLLFDYQYLPTWIFTDIFSIFDKCW